LNNYVYFNKSEIEENMNNISEKKYLQNAMTEGEAGTERLVIVSSFFGRLGVSGSLSNICNSRHGRHI